MDPGLLFCQLGWKPASASHPPVGDCQCVRTAQLAGGVQGSERQSS